MKPLAIIELSIIALFLFFRSSTNTKKIIVVQKGTCPLNYILVPKLENYTTRDFCVAKYEMKKDSNGMATSTPDNVPWIEIDRTTSAEKCSELGKGFKLISNEQWQTIARNIAGNKTNWSLGEIGDGELNRGYSGFPYETTYPVEASSDEVLGNCHLTQNSCSNIIWHAKRRTHTLSNGQVIWDLAGNVWEWVINDNRMSLGPSAHFSQLPPEDFRQQQFGAARETICKTPYVFPYCGLGFGSYNNEISAEAMARGGAWAGLHNGGIFRTTFIRSPEGTAINLGFRCVYAIEY